MSVTARNLFIDGPDLLKHYFAIDASPIYLTIDASVSTEGGSFTDPLRPNLDYVVSAESHTFPQLTRQTLRELNRPIFSVNEELTRAHSVSTYIDRAEDLDNFPDAGKFVAYLNSVDFNDGSLSPYSPSKFEIPNFTNGFSHSFDNAVEETDTLPSPPVATLSDLVMGGNLPLFRGSIVGGDLEMFIAYGMSYAGYFPTSEIVIDASAWTQLDFRDIRGTYSQTDTDSNGIEYVWSVTVG